MRGKKEKKLLKKEHVKHVVTKFTGEKLDEVHQDIIQSK